MNRRELILGVFAGFVSQDLIGNSDTDAAQHPRSRELTAISIPGDQWLEIDLY